MSSPSDQQHVIKVELNLGLMLGQFQREVQHIIDVVAFGLRAAEQDPSPTLGIPGAFISYGTGANATLTPSEARSRFKKWIVASGFRDATEAMNAFLEEVRSVCAVIRLSSREHFTEQDLISTFEDEKKKFHRLGLPDKLEHLKKFEPSIVPDSFTSVLSINQLRNALVHRHGIISERDLTEEDSLQVTWLRMEIVSDSAEGERIIKPNHIVAEGEKLYIRPVSAERNFALGESISLNAQEFGEICFTLFLLGQEMAVAVESFAQKVQKAKSEGLGSAGDV